MKLTVSNMDMNGGNSAKKSRSSATNFGNMEIHTTNMEKAATNGSAMDMNGINWKTNVKNTDMNTNKLKMNATNGNCHLPNFQINLFTAIFTPTRY